MRSPLKAFYLSVISALLALAAGAFIIETSGRDPFQVYIALFVGSLGTPQNITETLLSSIPLIFAGLSILLAYKCGLFNIGAEGQFLLGGVFAVSAGLLIHAPLFIHLPLCLCLGFLGGAICGAIPGWLKARFGLHEVISMMMLNWICLNFVRYIVDGPLKDPSGRGTPPPLSTALPPLLLPAGLIPDSRLHVGFLVALALLFLVSIFLSKTVQGYELRAVGCSPLASESCGISISRNMILAMVLSGGLSGLGAAFYYLGDSSGILSPVSFSGYGFGGIAVAFLGRTNPYGVLIASLFFGALEAGRNVMQLEVNIPRDFITIIQGIAVVFVVAPAFAETVFDWVKQKKDPEGVEFSS